MSGGNRQKVFEPGIVSSICGAKQVDFMVSERGVVESEHVESRRAQRSGRTFRVSAVRYALCVETSAKRSLLAVVKERLSAEIARATRGAREAADAATHEENKSEGDKDTRAIEASYVARGHATCVRDLEVALARLASVVPRSFESGDRVETCAIVEVEHAGRSATYFLLPAAGGQRIEFEGCDVRTLATSSPLGRALLGLVEGDEAEAPTGQGVKSCTIRRVR